VGRDGAGVRPMLHPPGGMECLLAGEHRGTRMPTAGVRFCHRARPLGPGRWGNIQDPWNSLWRLATTNTSFHICASSMVLIVLNSSGLIFSPHYQHPHASYNPRKGAFRGIRAGVAAGAAAAVAAVAVAVPDALGVVGREGRERCQTSPMSPPSEAPRRPNPRPSDVCGPLLDTGSRRVGFCIPLGQRSSPNVAFPPLPLHQLPLVFAVPASQCVSEWVLGVFRWSLQETSGFYQPSPPPITVTCGPLGQRKDIYLARFVFHGAHHV